MKAPDRRWWALLSLALACDSDPAKSADDGGAGAPEGSAEAQPVNEEAGAPDGEAATNEDPDAGLSDAEFARKYDARDTQSPKVEPATFDSGAWVRAEWELALDPKVTDALVLDDAVARIRARASAVSDAVVTREDHTARVVVGAVPKGELHRVQRLLLRTGEIGLLPLDVSRGNEGITEQLREPKGILPIPAGTVQLDASRLLRGPAQLTMKLPPEPPAGVVGVLFDGAPVMVGELPPEARTSGELRVPFVIPTLPDEYVAQAREWAATQAWGPLPVEVTYVSRAESPVEACAGEACETACAAGRGTACVALAEAAKTPEAWLRACRADVAMGCERTCDGADNNRCVDAATHLAFDALLAFDGARALSLFDRACEAGHLTACYDAGRFRFGDLLDVEPDFGRGRVQLKQACEAGQTEACDRLDDMLKSAEASCPDPEHAEDGEPGQKRRQAFVAAPLCIHAAHVYEEGLRKDASPDQANEYWRRAGKWLRLQKG